MDKEVKSKKGKIFYIIVLVILLLAVSVLGVLLYKTMKIQKAFKYELETVEKEKEDVEKQNKEKDKIIQEKDKKINELEQKIDGDESVDISKKEIEKYFNYISPTSVGGPSELLYNKKEVIADKLSLGEKIKYVSALLESKTTSSSDYSTENIKESDVKKILNEVYGPNTYQRTEFSLGCGTFKLNKKTGVYSAGTGCGGTSSIFDANEIINYKITSSKIEIVSAYAFFDGQKGKIYKDYNRKQAVDNYKGDETNATYKYLSNYVKKNKNKLNHLTYTFESSDGVHYYFKALKNSM